jgi:N,N'-diacetyllegionaminate synthase
MAYKFYNLKLANKVFIIAEAGVNHNGDLATAKQLVDVAADAGADCVKFQTFRAKKLVSAKAKLAEYQQKNTGDSHSSQYNMLKKLELPEEWHYELKQYAEQKGILFLSTGFDEDSIDFLEKLGIPFFKVPSGEITNKPYLQHIAAKGKSVILSTGMSDLHEIEAAVNVLTDGGITKEMITVLHCNTAYPTPMSDVNLQAMNTIKTRLGVTAGYSDHTQGTEVSIAAVALGAAVIEKHFTLDRNMPGPDHAASLEPGELRSMVSAIRNITLAISGNGEKEPAPSEQKNKASARKSIHLKNAITAGHILTADDLEMKRPGDGISPMVIDNIIGKKVTADLPAEHKLTLNDIN